MFLCILILFTSVKWTMIEVVDVRGKTLSRDTDKGMAYARFKAHKFSLLNITNIGSDYVLKGSECGLACVNMPSCFSFNLASFSDIVNGKILCELLPSDRYNNSAKHVGSKLFQHYSILSPCISWPCQNNGTCVALYEKNSYMCVCAKGFTGKYCETGMERVLAPHFL
ncbi:neurogenic locus notch homolog protein 1-like [Orbicella faveolata]|uniref:neurogenic locus notch homolog protein 1-like n=1 Tax=Orbicella faveolata TaxID=48498 RepID=UPI0009E21233|nr:neurogenic locus notch homolog protein 1-like [Orbicella faveolata]